jgi:hypothetical protein
VVHRQRARITRFEDQPTARPNVRPAPGRRRQRRAAEADQRRTHCRHCGKSVQSARHDVPSRAARAQSRHAGRRRLSVQRCLPPVDGTHHPLRPAAWPRLRGCRRRDREPDGSGEHHGAAGRLLRSDGAGTRTGHQAAASARPIGARPRSRARKRVQAGGSGGRRWSAPTPFDHAQLTRPGFAAPNAP